MGMPRTMKGSALKRYRAVKSVGKLVPTPAKKKRVKKKTRNIKRGGYRI